MPWEDFLDYLAYFVGYPWGPTVPPALLSTYGENPRLNTILKNFRQMFDGTYTEAEVKCVRALIGKKKKKNDLNFQEYFFFFCFCKCFILFYFDKIFWIFLLNFLLFSGRSEKCGGQRWSKWGLRSRVPRICIYRKIRRIFKIFWTSRAVPLHECEWDKYFWSREKFVLFIVKKKKNFFIHHFFYSKFFFIFFFYQLVSWKYQYRWKWE